MAIMKLYKITQKTELALEPVTFPLALRHYSVIILTMYYIHFGWKYHKTFVVNFSRKEFENHTLTHAMMFRVVMLCSDVLRYDKVKWIAPFTSPWRRRQHGPPKLCYPTTSFLWVITQTTTTWIDRGCVRTAKEPLVPIG